MEAKVVENLEYDRRLNVSQWAQLERGATAAILLAIITVIALFLRIRGIHWGIADGQFFHPDESNYVIDNALRIYQNKTLEFLNYPQFLMLLTSGSLKVWHALGGNVDVVTAHYVGRSWSILLGTCNVIVAYLLVLEISQSRIPALLAALTLSFLPLHVWHSHYATTDIGATLFISLALLFAIKFLNQQQLKYIYLSAFCCGLAAANKYTAGMVIVCTVAAYTFAPNSGRKLLGYTLVGLFAFLAFFFGTPLSVLDIPGTLETLAYEAEHVRQGHYGFNLVEGSRRYTAVLFPLVLLLIFAMGPFLYAVTLPSIFIVGWKRVWPIFLFCLCWCALKVFNIYQPARYYLPIVTLLSLLPSIAVMRLGSISIRALRMGLIIWLVVFLLTCIYAVSTNERYVKDTRVIASEWLKQRVLPQDYLGYLGLKFTQPASPELLKAVDGYWFVKPHDSEAVSYANDADWLITPSLGFNRFRREASPFFDYYATLLPGNSPKWAAKQQIRSPFFLRAFMEWLDPMFASYYVSPDIYIFRRGNYLTPPIRAEFSDQEAIDRVSRNHVQWYGAESWGSWAKPRHGEVWINLPEDYDYSPLKVEFAMYAFTRASEDTLNGKEGDQTVIVTVNGRPHTYTVADYRKDSHPVVKSIIVSAEDVRQHGHIRVGFEALDPVSHGEVIGVDDDRKVGVGLAWIDIKKAE